MSDFLLIACASLSPRLFCGNALATIRRARTLGHCVRIRVCLYACAHVCMYACAYVCVYNACAHVCLYACVRICECVRDVGTYVCSSYEMT